MRRSHSGHLPGVLPLIVLLITTISCASLANAPTSLAPAPTSTPSPSTPSATLPPVVQTADALNAMIETFVASIPTSATAAQTVTAVPAVQTAQAQFAAFSTLAASIDLTAPAKQVVTPLSGAQATATPTPLQGGGGSGGLGGGGGGSGSGSGGGGSGGSGGGGGGGGSGGGGSGSGGAGGGSGSGGYVVKQIETLGGEVISGFVCSLTAPFSVNSKTPKVAFVFGFLPQDATHGQVGYAYSIPSAGEAHSATGTYTLSPAGADGTLLLAMTVSDHVTFKGFDGNIPLRYKFDLVPSGSTPCP